MEGMKISIQAISDASLGTEKMMEMMRQQVLPLSQCGNVCKAAAALVPQGSGNIYKRVEGFESSKFVMGNTDTQDMVAQRIYSTLFLDTVMPNFGWEKLMQQPRCLL
jgi:(2Fe-2S) ferredoxin